MAFDPDAYLASKQVSPVASGGFDPDAYLASKKPPAPTAAPTAAPKPPGMLDNLESSAGRFAQDATKYGLPGAGLRAFGRGAQTLGEGIANAGDWAGKKTTDVATSLGAPAPLAAGAGVAANVGLQAVPMIFGGGEARAAAPAMRSGAEKLMQWALKPTVKAATKGYGKIAAQEMLDRNIPLTERGVENIQQAITDLNNKVSSTIANSKATVKVSDIEQAFKDTIKKHEGMPKADVDLMKKQLTDFKKHPLVVGKTSIPIQDAQKLKQGFYKSVNEKYGQEGTGTTEAQKAIAKALKEDIAVKAPPVVEWNRQETRLLRTLTVAQRRVIQEANRNILGLKGLRLRQPASFAAMMMDESGVFKAFMARLLNAGQTQIPVAAARTGIGALEAGNQMRINQNNQRPPTTQPVGPPQ